MARVKVWNLTLAFESPPRAGGLKSAVVVAQNEISARAKASRLVHSDHDKSLWLDPCLSKCVEVDLDVESVITATFDMST